MQITSLQEPVGTGQMPCLPASPLLLGAVLGGLHQCAIPESTYWLIMLHQWRQERKNWRRWA